MSAEAVRMVRKEELMRLLLAGYMLKECAQQLQVSYHTACAYARQPEFMVELKELSSSVYARVDEELRCSKEQITQRLEVFADKALAELEKMLFSDNAAERVTNPALRAKICMDALDRNSATAKNKKVETDNRHHIDPITLMHAARVAQEMDSKMIEGEK